MLGGAIRTAELTAPGYRHEVFSCWHPLFVGGPAYPRLKDDLDRRGLAYRNTATPTGVVMTDGATAVLSTDEDALTAELDRHADGDGAVWRREMGEFGARSKLAFGALGTELWSTAGVRLGLRALLSMRASGTLAFMESALEPATAWLQRTFRSEQARALFAPWINHNGMGPDDAGSAFMLKVIASATVQGGIPVPVGGGVTLVEALASIVRDNGGELHTGATVDRIVVRSGRAVAAVTADGTRYGARHAVLASTTPQALYLDLLRNAELPAVVRDAARRYRWGRSDMQIHAALREPLRWRDSRLDSVPLVHVTPGLDGVRKAVGEAGRDVLPARPSIAAGQPTVLDPSRAPDGAAVLWIQLLETPYRPSADAAGEIDVGDGTWTPQLTEAYADRVLAQLGEQVTNLDRAVLTRAVLSPADLERENPNLVHGDPYSGACTLDQFLLWRPIPPHPGHQTPVERLWHIGAATHPGPGLSGASGHIVATHLLRRGPLERLRGLLAAR
ncbi:NAD(P)/FAD-dependent oxidoreductase [Dactylosporangium darangshiense]|uniref:NAD(P)/FAD-dependent oxidoreductase n=1 Tax=Dactylosporangium darangshiense TaxID=579108 RepID=A0ABP8DST3_9ACTN